MRVCVVLCGLSAPARARAGEPPPRAGGERPIHGPITTCVRGACVPCSLCVRSVRTLGPERVPFGLNKCDKNPTVILSAHIPEGCSHIVPEGVLTYGDGLHGARQARAIGSIAGEEGRKENT